MPFSNPIVGGQSKLIRQAIQSPNYLPGVQGWSINRDGTAEFAGGSFRGPVTVTDNQGNTLGGINSDGNFSGPDGFFSDDVFIDGLAVDGSASSSPNILRVPGGAVGGAIIDSLPYGLVSNGPFLVSGGRSVATGVTWGLASNSFQAELGRMYYVTFHHVKIRPTATGGNVTVSLRMNLPAFDGDQTTAAAPVGGGALFAGYSRHPILNATYDLNGTFGPFVCNPSADIPHSGLVQMCLDLTPSGNTVIYDQPAAGLPYVAHFDVHDAGPFISATTGFLDVGAGGSTAPTQNFTRTYTCTASATYDSGGSKITGFGSEMNQGYNQGTGGSYGSQQSMAIFPNMTSDLAGATITGMSVTIHNHHWWKNAGGTVEIGFHGNTSLPSSFNIGDWPKITGGMTGGQTKTFSIPSSSWASWISGAYRGINLHAPSNDSQYYGRFDGQGWSYPPKITVTYTK